MSSKTLKIAFSLFLLLYFVGFAVSPVSAIIPLEQLDNDIHKDVFKEQRTQADLFFIDLALWEVLKQAKCSDNSAYIISSQKNDWTATTIDSIIIDGAIEGTRDVLLYVELTRFRAIAILSPATTPRLTHSGPSPPLFS